MRFTAALVLLLSLSGSAFVQAEEPAAAASTNTAPTAPAAPTDDALAPAPAEVATLVYMVARIKLTGTDLTQVVFFRHAAISSLEACEEERDAGLTTGWNHFSGYYLKTLKGIPYKVEYLCVQGEQHLASWQRGTPMDHFYLVRTVDKKLVVENHRNFFECRDALRATTHEESIDAFCSIASQAILPALPTP